MAVIAPPELPPLIVNKNGKYRYVMTYTSKWDKEKKNSKRTSFKTVGTLGEDGVSNPGLITPSVRTMETAIPV